MNARHDAYMENRERAERVLDTLILHKPLEWNDHCWLANMLSEGIESRYGPHCHCGAPVDEKDAECSDCFRDRKLDEAGDDEYDRHMAAEFDTPRGA